MSNLVILFIHFIATLARLLGPGGVRSIVAESLILKHQLLIVARSRQRSPNLCTSDRILAGLMALLVRPTRLLRSAIRSALPAGTGLWWSFLADFPGPHERQSLEHLIHDDQDPVGPQGGRLAPE
jgi:hypothetical protein